MTDMNEKQIFCDKCGALDKGERVYTADSFETCFKWKCSLLNGKVISSCVDWNEHNIPALKECPLNERFVDPKTPKGKTIENWKIKNIKLTKENKALRKESTQLKRKLNKIHEMSSK